MTRNDIRIQFNKEKDIHVLQTEGTGYIHYTDDYVHWLEDIALKQANEVTTKNGQNAVLCSGRASLPCKDLVVAKGYDIANNADYNYRRVLKEPDHDIYYSGWMDCYDWLILNER